MREWLQLQWEGFRSDPMLIAKKSVIVIAITLAEGPVPAAIDFS